jgi:lipoprotein
MLQSYKKFLKQQVIPCHSQPLATTLASCSLSSFTFAPNFKITDYQ